MLDAESEEPRSGTGRPAGKTPLKVKLAMAATSLLLLLVVLEIAARLMMPNLAPVRIRDGYYGNPLPLITGSGPPLSLKYLPEGARLPEQKAEGEMRVFVYGESSVAGSPFDANVSVCAMLHDELREAFPGRKVSVVNMGRPGSICTNVYYYLLAARRLSPDWAVFFMGFNDDEREVGEQCAAVTRPRLHAAWRSLAESSWALWLARAFGPQYVWALTAKKDWHPAKDCARGSFGWWTDHLVRTAMEGGAKVVIATPVVSVERKLELLREDRGAGRPGAMSDVYKKLLACRLDESCDHKALFAATLAAPEGSRSESSNPTTLLEQHYHDVEVRADAWRRASEANGAELIELHRLLAEKTPGGVTGSPHFADWLRLLPHGYLYLARLARERIRAVETGLPERPIEMPTRADVQPYLDASQVSGVKSALDQFFRRDFLTGLPTFEYALETWPPGFCERKRFCSELDLARVALGWLRREAGLPHGLDPELAKRIDTYDPKAPYKKTTL